MTLSLYVHIPFCRRKCHYCDFFSVPAEEGPRVDDYLAALEKEFQLYVYGRELGAVKLESIYIGGGTPSILSVGHLEHLLSLLDCFFERFTEAEFTVEVNPESIDRDKLRFLAEGGVNRLSFGLQSTEDSQLTWLGRRHTFSVFREAWMIAREAGFANMSIDLIYGLPHQDLSEWKKTLEKTLAFEPEHLSVYGLTIEEGAVFGNQLRRGKLKRLPGEDAQRLLFDAARELLGKAGYTHYEISNFARPGFQGRHNRRYWEAEPYLGCGAGASGFLQGTRYSNYCSLSAYSRAVHKDCLPVAEKERLDEETAMSEAMILGLRLLEGVSISRFCQKFGIRPDQVFGDTLSRLVQKGMLEMKADRIYLTPDAVPVANLVFSEFLPSLS